MTARRDPAPFGSRRPDRADVPLWMFGDIGYVDSPANRARRGRLKPEFFRMLRDLRATRIRLVIEVVALCAGIALFFVLPFIAMGLVVVAVVAIIFDLFVLARLRRRVTEAWEDLALESG